MQHERCEARQRGVPSTWTRRAGSTWSTPASAKASPTPTAASSASTSSNRLQAPRSRPSTWAVAALLASQPQCGDGAIAGCDLSRAQRRAGQTPRWVVFASVRAMAGKVQLTAAGRQTPTAPQPSLRFASGPTPKLRWVAQRLKVIADARCAAGTSKRGERGWRTRCTAWAARSLGSAARPRARLGKSTVTRCSCCAALNSRSRLRSGIHMRGRKRAAPASAPPEPHRPRARRAENASRPFPTAPLAPPPDRAAATQTAPKSPPPGTARCRRHRRRLLRLGDRASRRTPAPPAAAQAGSRPASHRPPPPAKLGPPQQQLNDQLGQKAADRASPDAQRCALEALHRRHDLPCRSRGVRLVSLITPVELFRPAPRLAQVVASRPQRQRAHLPRDGSGGVPPALPWLITRSMPDRGCRRGSGFGAFSAADGPDSPPDCGRFQAVGRARFSGRQNTSLEVV